MVTVLNYILFIILSLTVACNMYLQYSCDMSYAPQDGRTALIWASDSGHTEVVQLLLGNGAQVDLQDKVRHNLSGYK